MAMRWDPFLARALARELDAVLAGARVRALLLDEGRRRLHLYLREGTLVAELHPAAGWISLLGAVDPLPGEARPLPCRVRSVTPLPDESALVLDLPRVRGKEEGVRLILEFSANRGNAFVVGHRSGVIRHVLLPRRSGGRDLVAGAPWTPLPTGGRAGSPEGPALDEPGFRARAAAGRRALLQGISLASSLNAEALLGPDAPGAEDALLSAEGSPPGKATRPGAGGPRGWGGWPLRLAMEDPAAPPVGPGSATSPSTGSPPWGGWILPSPRGPFVYPLRLAGVDEGAAEEAGTLLAAMARLRSRAPAVASPGRLLLPPDLLARAEERLARLERQRAALRRELSQAPDPAPLRSLGDLLLAHFHEIPRGAPEVRLADFDGNPVTIPLDPALPVHENARRWYERAGRAERAREELPRRITAVEGAIGRLEEALQAASHSADEGSAEAVGALVALVGADPAGPGPYSAGAGAPRQGRGRPSPRGRADAPSLPYRRFRSSGGLEIRVGRGARRNDELTFRHAAPGDIWLHVREAPGAHVVLRWSREGNPPARDLEEAATLAALHSEARHAGMVPVDWTRRRHVRKPRKAAPGAVLPERVRTIFVRPDPAVETRLRVIEPGTEPSPGD